MVIPAWVGLALVGIGFLQLVAVVVCVRFVRRAARVQLSALPTLLASIEGAGISGAGGPNGYTFYGGGYPEEPPGEEYEEELEEEMELDGSEFPVVDMTEEDLALLEAEGRVDLDPAVRELVYKQVRNESRRHGQEAP